MKFIPRFRLIVPQIMQLPMRFLKTNLFLLSWLLGSLLYTPTLHAKKRRAIKTTHFQIIFDSNNHKDAQRIAHTLEALYRPISATMYTFPFPIRIWLDYASVDCNGYFQPMPRHIWFSMFHCSDPHFVSNNDWPTLLCLHEFRHAVQHSVKYQSTPTWLRPLYFGANLITILDVPRFLSEGDAVGIETVLSKHGRGRLPAWSRLYKMQILERTPSTLEQHIFSSFKQEMPLKFYVLGYYFSTHIRRKYGPNALADIYRHTIRSIPFYGFYNAITKVTKKSITQVYHEMNQELALAWKQQIDKLTPTQATHLTIKQPHDQVNYTNPVIDESGAILAWKHGLGVRTQLVRLRPIDRSKITDTQIEKTPLTEQRLLYSHMSHGYIISSLCPIGRESVLWLEHHHHPWRGIRSARDNKYHEQIQLKYYHFKTKKYKTLIKSCRYHAIALNPTDTQAVAVASDEMGSYFLVILEIKTGKVIKQLPNPGNVYYLTPSWVNETDVVIVQTKNEQNSIVRINVPTGHSDVLLAYSEERRSMPKIYGNYLLYDSSFNGIDNIYAMHLETKACFQVTSRKHGAYLGMVDLKKNQLIFSDYTKNGMEIAIMPFNPKVWKPIEQVADVSIEYHAPLVAQEQLAVNATDLPYTLDYPIRKYSFWKDNLAWIGMSLTQADNSLMRWELIPFEATNLSGDLKITPHLSYAFGSDQAKKYKRKKQIEWGIKCAYYSVYPIVETAFDCFKQDDKSMAWEQEASLGITLPYYFTLPSSTGRFSISPKLTWHRYKAQQCWLSHLYSFELTNHSTKSERDIIAPFFQKFNLVHRGETASFDSSWIFKAQIGFPGIGLYHYLHLSYHCSLDKGFGRRNKKLTSTEKEKIYKRGFGPLLDRPDKTQETAICYGLPIWYPERGVPLLWYCKRVCLEGHINVVSTKDIFMEVKNLQSFGIRCISLHGLLLNSSIMYEATLDFYWEKSGHPQSPSNRDWKFNIAPSFAVLA